MAHTFDPARAERLEDDSRYRYCSREELLGLFDPDPADRVLDVGSGTGFYTRDYAPFVDHVLALDLQPAMHEFFRGYGVPKNVSLLVGAAKFLPIRDGTIDAVISTMTFHEIATDQATAEIGRVLSPGGRFVAVDWSGLGNGESGPPLGDRLSAKESASMVTDAGFTVDRAVERAETFTLVAHV